jgi:hypothetical protein
MTWIGKACVHSNEQVWGTVNNVAMETIMFYVRSGSTQGDTHEVGFFVGCYLGQTLGELFRISQTGENK